MEGHEPGSRTIEDGPRLTRQPAVIGDRTIGTIPEMDGPPRLTDDVRQRWEGGRIALLVAGLGLLGAAFGGVWLLLADQFGLNPGGVTGFALGLAAVVLLGGGAILLVGGIGYYVLAPAFMGPAMAWQDVGSHRLVLATTILIVILANAVPLGYMAIVGPQDFRSVGGLVMAALSVDIALLLVTYLRFIRPGVITAADLGLSRSGLVYHIGVGLGVGVVVLVVSGLVQTALKLIGVQQTQLEGLLYVRSFPLLGFLAVVFAGGVLAPIAEELYFRGFVFGVYHRTRGPLVSYGVTSLVFASLHLNPQALLPILVLSLILCYTYRRTGSIVPGIVAHGVNNSTAFCILYFTSAPLAGG
jgi:membrane protease YdiL (CAAX protease family)